MIRKRKPGGGRIGHPIKNKIHLDFKEAVRSFGPPLYKIAQKAGINPTELYHMVSDREYLYPPDDPRVKKIKKVIGYKGPCFDIPQEKKIANS